MTSTRARPTRSSSNRHFLTICDPYLGNIELNTDFGVHMFAINMVVVGMVITDVKDDFNKGEANMVKESSF